MSVSPLSRGPRTITEGDVLAIAAELAPTTGRLTTTRERDPMTDRDLYPAAQAEALRRADAATFDRLVAAAFEGDQAVIRTTYVHYPQQLYVVTRSDLRQVTGEAVRPQLEERP